MQTPGQTKQRAADLYWLAFLLTERRESSADIAAAAVASQDGDGPYFSSWMLSWSRSPRFAVNFERQHAGWN
jgi:hypothetical protein